MIKVISLASRRAANPVQPSAQVPTSKPAPASPVLVPGAQAVERQQAIENALSMALFYIRTSDTPQGIHSATAKAVRAAAMLKQACIEAAIGGRA